MLKVRLDSKKKNNKERNKEGRGTERREKKREEEGKGKVFRKASEINGRGERTRLEWHMAIQGGMGEKRRERTEMWKRRRGENVEREVGRVLREQRDGWRKRRKSREVRELPGIDPLLLLSTTSSFSPPPTLAIALLTIRP